MNDLWTDREDRRPPPRVGKRPMLVLDGHDGAGKSTLSRRLATELGGVWVRPFSGSGGESMLAAAESGDEASAAEMATAAVEGAMAAKGGSPLIFDRHWMTVFTLVGEEHYGAWMPLPPTVLCWIDLESTLGRLAERREAPQTSSYHERYLRLYRSLAKRFACPILRTDRLSVEESLDRLVLWSKRHLRMPIPSR